MQLTSNLSFDTQTAAIGQQLDSNWTLTRRATTLFEAGEIFNVIARPDLSPQGLPARREHAKQPNTHQQREPCRGLGHCSDADLTIDVEPVGLPDQMR
jgi:hypothetical protein